jgi:hypothetical protein
VSIDDPPAFDSELAAACPRWIEAMTPNPVSSGD